MKRLLPLALLLAGCPNGFSINVSGTIHCTPIDGGMYCTGDGVGFPVDGGEITDAGEPDSGTPDAGTPDAGAPPAQSFRFLMAPPSERAECTGAAIDGITYSRGSPSGCETNDLYPVQLTGNQLPDEGAGLLFEPRGNFRNYTGVEGGHGYVKTSAVGPDGVTSNVGCYADAPSDLATYHNFYFTNFTNAPNVSRVVASCYARGAEINHIYPGTGYSGAGVRFDLSRKTWKSGNAISGDIEGAGNGFVRFSFAVNDVGAGDMNIPFGRSEVDTGDYASTDGGRIFVGQCNIVVGGSELAEKPTRYVEVTSAPVDRLPGVATFANPVDGGAFTFGGYFAPAHGDWKGMTRGLMKLPGAADLWVTDAGILKADFFDGDGGVKTWTSDRALVNYSNLIRATNDNGVITVRRGSKVLSGTLSGTGTGIPSVFPTSGTFGAGFWGNIPFACVESGANTCQFPAITPVELSPGLWRNPYYSNEPVTCQTGGFQANGVIMASSNYPGPNSWVVSSTNSVLSVTSFDDLQHPRTMTGLFPQSGSVVEYCNLRGLPLLTVDGKPFVPMWPNGITQTFFSVDGFKLTVNGTGHQTAQAPAIATDGGCFAREQGVCGTKPKMALVLGDSLSSGSTDVGNLNWSQLAQIYAADAGINAVVYPYGIGMAKSDEVAGYEYDNTRSADWDFVTVQCCTNDMLAFAGGDATRTAANVWGRIRDRIVFDAIASGARVVLIIPTPWKMFGGDSAPWNTAKPQVDGLRSLMLDHCATYPTQVTCIDNRFRFSSSADPDILDTVNQIPNWNDNMHWGPTPHQVMAGDFVQVLQ